MSDAPKTGEPVAWLMEAGIGGSFDRIGRRWTLTNKADVEACTTSKEPIRAIPLYAHPPVQGEPVACDVTQADVDAFTRTLFRDKTPWADGCANLILKLWNSRPLEAWPDSPVAGEPQVEDTFEVWTKTLPATHWARYDLSACQLGWDAASKQKQAEIIRLLNIINQPVAQTEQQWKCCTYLSSMAGKWRRYDIHAVVGREL